MGLHLPCCVELLLGILGIRKKRCHNLLFCFILITRQIGVSGIEGCLSVRFQQFPLLGTTVIQVYMRVCYYNLFMRIFHFRLYLCNFILIIRLIFVSGPNKHFYMYVIHERLSNAMNKKISSKDIWDKLNKMYDLEALVSSKHNTTLHLLTF